MAADHTPCIKQWMRREEETGHLLDSSELKDFRKLLLPTTTFPLPLPPPSISFFLLQQITNISEYIQLKNTRRLHLVVQADRSEDFKKKKTWRVGKSLPWFPCQKLVRSNLQILYLLTQIMNHCSQICSVQETSFVLGIFLK